MKKYFLAFSLVLTPFIVKAAPLYTESPISSVGTPATVAISSTTLTKVPTTQTGSRVGLYISNPSTITVAGFLGDCTSTSLASTIRPIEFTSTINNLGPSTMFYLPLRYDVCLWLITTDSTLSTRNIHYQEVSK